METEALIERVEEDLDTGWFTIHTSDGKFTTKVREKAHEANGLKGSRALIHFTEKNRESNGRTYTNRYYDRASEIPVTPTASADGGIEQVGGGGTGSRRTHPQDAWRMCLNKGGELAVATLPLMAAETQTFPNQKAIAEAWARFFFFTPMPEHDVPYVQQAQQAQLRGYDDAPSAQGEGIPF